MCSSIKYVLKVIIFSIFILVTGIEKGRLCFRKLPPGPWGLTFLLWSTRLRILTNEWASSVWKSLGSLSPGMWFEGCGTLSLTSPGFLVVENTCWAPNLEPCVSGGSLTAAQKNLTWSNRNVTVPHPHLSKAVCGVTIYIFWVPFWETN